MHSYRFAAIIVLALVLAAAPAWAGAPTDQLRGHVDQVVRLLGDPSLKDRPAERHARVRKVAEDIFDYGDTARRALGPHWNERTPQEKDEFIRLFTDLLDRAYASKIDLYQGENVKWVGESMDNGDAVVKTQILTKSGQTVPVDYRMHDKNGRWLVYDVIIEGASLVSNYRTQFNKIVQTESYQALVERLRSRVATPAASPRR